MLSAVSCLSLSLNTVQTSALSSDSRKSVAVLCSRHAGLVEQASVSQNHAFMNSGRRSGSRRRALVQRAASQDASGAGTSGEFNLTEYVEAKVERGKEIFRTSQCVLTVHSQACVCCSVERSEKDSSVILLKMLDGRGNILPVFVGEA